MHLDDALRELEALTDDGVRTRNEKNGAGDRQYGVRLGDIRKVAKSIKANHELALELWDTDNIDARLLATLLVKPKKLSAEELDQWVRAETFPQVADWLNAYVVEKHPEREALREPWMDADDPMAARAGWSLTWKRLMKSREGLDPAALLDRLELEMGDAAPEAQWTMNFALIEIGIHFAEHRERAIEIGETLGLYRDYPVSKGCVSPFAPIAIPEMVKRSSK